MFSSQKGEFDWLAVIIQLSETKVYVYVNATWNGMAIDRVMRRRNLCKSQSQAVSISCLKVIKPRKSKEPLVRSNVNNKHAVRC